VSTLYHPAINRTGAGTRQHRLKIKSTPLEPLIDALAIEVGTPVAIGVTVRDGELALSLDAEPAIEEGANVMTVQGDGPERSYLRVTVPEPLAVALDLDARGLRADESTVSEQRAVLPLGGITQVVDGDPVDETPIYRTGAHEAVQTYLPPAIGETLGIDVGDRVRFSLALADDRPALVVDPTTDTGPATAAIHGVGPDDTQLETTLPKAVAHALGIGRSGDQGESIRWKRIGEAAVAVF
jgi:hypothetical protein